MKINKVVKMWLPRYIVLYIGADVPSEDAKLYSW